MISLLSERAIRTTRVYPFHSQVFRRVMPHRHGAYENFLARGPSPSPANPRQRHKAEASSRRDPGCPWPPRVSGLGAASASRCAAGARAAVRPEQCVMLANENAAPPSPSGAPRTPEGTPCASPYGWVQRTLLCLKVEVGNVLLGNDAGGARTATAPDNRHTCAIGSNPMKLGAGACRQKPARMQTRWSQKGNAQAGKCKCRNKQDRGSHQAGAKARKSTRAAATSQHRQGFLFRPVPSRGSASSWGVACRLKPAQNSSRENPRRV